MSDPWTIQNTATTTTSKESENKLAESAVNDTSLEFEDNFGQQPTTSGRSSSNSTNSQHHQPLPDSANYLLSLERKLEKIKKNPKLVDALTEKREQSLRNLLEQDIVENQNNNLELDAPIHGSDSAVQEIYRHLQPVQALSVGETVEIVKHDQLQEESTEQQNEH